MPKEFRQRARRHARAAGYAEEEQDAAATAGAHAIVDVASMDIDAGDGKAAAQTPAVAAAVSSAPAAAIAFAPTSHAKEAKPKTKLERRHAKRAAFRSKMMMPGETAKFELSSLNTLGSLTASLVEATAKESNQPAGGAQKKRGISKKQRKQMANQDIANFSAVASHPAFRANSLAAIREHFHVRCDGCCPAFADSQTLQTKEAIEQQQLQRAQQMEKKAGDLEQMIDEISDAAVASSSSSSSSSSAHSNAAAPAGKSKPAASGAGSSKSAGRNGSGSSGSSSNSSSGLTKSARRRLSRKKHSTKGGGPSTRAKMEDE